MSAEKTFDLRTLEQELARGNITPKDYEKYLKELPDDEGNYNTMVLAEEEIEEEAVAAENVVEETEAIGE